MEPVVLLPHGLDGRHVLALPQGADVLALARAWFLDPVWTREPRARAAAARPVSGARFRGIQVDEEDDQPGAVRLSAEAGLIGPLTLSADEARTRGLPVGAWDLYAAADPDATQPPAAVPHQVTRWFVATARHVGGVVVPADRATMLAPDPAQGIDLTLWSAVPLLPERLVTVVRPALAGVRLGAPQVARADVPGPSPYALTATSEYDGDVQITVARATAVPVVLSRVQWREHGPWAYRVRWQPLDPDELASEQPSRLHVIARDRVAPMLARVAVALRQEVAGTVVDAGGFVVPLEELETRARPDR